MLMILAAAFAALPRRRLEQRLTSRSAVGCYAQTSRDARCLSRATGCVHHQYVGVRCQLFTMRVSHVISLHNLALCSPFGDPSLSATSSLRGRCHTHPAHPAGSRRLTCELVETATPEI